MRISEIRVDIVIPAYNAGAYIAECLDSIWKQSLRPNCVIVVDDGSTDNTAALVREYAATHPGPRLQLISQENKGIAGARNTGIDAATAEFVALLDADDLWSPEKLERQAALFRAPGTDRLGLVYCDYRLIDEDGAPVYAAKHVAPRLRGKVRCELRRGNLISGSASAVLIRRAALQDVGSFDESLICCEDWDLWLRISQNWEVDFVPDALTHIRRHSQSIQLDSHKMVEGDLKVAVKLSEQGELNVRQWLGLLIRMHHLSIRLSDFPSWQMGRITQALFSHPLIVLAGVLEWVTRPGRHMWRRIRPL